VRKTTESPDGAAAKASKRNGSTKNKAAVALGKLGGRKGGLARAKNLTPGQRTAIAKKAANARWKKSRRNRALGR
jgi:hypothetical protein